MMQPPTVAEVDLSRLGQTGCNIVSIILTDPRQFDILRVLSARGKIGCNLIGRNGSSSLQCSPARRPWPLTALPTIDKAVF
jgi:hypothetical protein